MINSKQRFSNRVENYIKYRPGYPPEVKTFLINNIGLTKNSDIADIGSGTGIFARLIINDVKTVFAVEPNEAMRKASEEILSTFSNFIPVSGSAEATNLPDQSVDFVAAAQSFHWFDIEKSKKEFIRILKPGGKIILLWNNRLVNTQFLKEYDELLKKYANDYNEVNHQNITDDILNSFFVNGLGKKTFPNRQTFDFNGVIGRLLSSSYAPLPGENNYDILKKEVEKLYNLYNEKGFIDFNYSTEIYWGKIE